MIESCSVASATPGKAMDDWNDRLSGLYSGLVADIPEPAGFLGELAWSSAGPFRCVRARANVCQLSYTARPSRDEPAFLLKLQKSGRSVAEQIGSEARLGPGDLIVFDTEAPYRLTLLDASETLSVLLPKSELGNAGYGLERIVGQRLPASNPSVQLSADFARSIWAVCHAGKAGRLPKGSIEILGQLLRFCTTADAPHQDASRVNWADIEAHVLAHIEDPEFNIGKMSADMGLSARRLQQIFQERGSTPSRYILERRLQVARQRLSESGLRDRTIARISLDSGFGDITYFGRAFRARYGRTPQAFRKSLDT